MGVKDIVVQKLQEYFGDYVDGLSAQNMQLQLLAGTITQNNLELKAEALQRLNLPIVVRAGRVRQFHVDVPWASLSSKPVVVNIHGVTLIAAPNGDIDPRAPRYSCVKTTPVWATHALSSAETGVLEAGTVILALSSRLLPDGTRRVQFNRGWVSVATHRNVILERCDGGVDAGSGAALAAKLRKKLQQILSADSLRKAGLGAAAAAEEEGYAARLGRKILDNVSFATLAPFTRGKQNHPALVF